MNLTVNPALMITKVLTYCKDLTFSFLSSDSNCCTFKLACTIVRKGTDAAKDPLDRVNDL